MSVGNLPPQSDVLIKITYVAELPLEGEQINFLLPGCVAPWAKDSALADKVQVSFACSQPSLMNILKFEILCWLLFSDALFKDTKFQFIK